MEDGAGETQPDDEDMEEATGSPDITATSRGHLLRKYSGTEEYTGIPMVRVQHRRNLAAIMRHAMLTSDYEAAAGAVGTLLGCMPEGAHMNKYVELSPGGLELRDSVLEMAWNMLEVMRQYEVTHEQFKRFLNKVTSLLRMEQTMRQVGKLEIVMAHWTKDSGELRTCLDLIRNELGRKHLQTVALPSARNFTFHLSTFQAYIRHSIWMEQILSSLSDLASSHSSQPSTPINNDTTSSTTHAKITQDLLGPLQLGPFVPQDDIITLLQSQDNQQSTQQSQGFMQPSQGFSQPPSVPMTQQSQAQVAGQPSQGAAQGTALSGDGDLESLKRSLQRALEMLPAALLPALLLCHTLVITDNQEDAAAVAQAAVDSSGRSSESLSLLAVVKEATATQDAQNGSSTQLDRNSTDYPAVTAAAAGDDYGAAASGDGTTSGPQPDATGHADESSIHQYVELCLEILMSDPRQLGAVQGLVQMCSHCHHCAAAAVQGILAHLDAAALGVTTAAEEGREEWGLTSATADEAETSAATLWSVLSVLLVQLATAVAVDAAQQAAAAAVVKDSQHESMEVDTREPASTTAAAAVHTDACPHADHTAVQLIWEDLQDSFIGRRRWWLGAGSVADVTELHVLWPKQQHQQQQEEMEEQQQQQQQTKERGLQEGGGCDNFHKQQQQQQEQGEARLKHPDAEAVEGPTEPTEQQQQTRQQMSQSEQCEIILLRGADSETDREDASPVSQQDHSRDSAAAAAEPAAGQADNADAAVQANGSGGWSDVQQTLCCKAIALVFVLGSQNAFGNEAFAALEAAASAGGESDSGNGEQQDAEDLSVVAARAALQDAFQLCQQTDAWVHLRQQQRLQQLVKQQLQQHAVATRLLGTPSEMFGGMLDMPGSWWMCFPHKRRQYKQQQQRQQQHP